MSRGLGTLQRATLEALPAHEAHYAGVYDLHAVKFALVNQWGAWDGWNITASFDASFSRAVRTLFMRGLLRPSAYIGQNGYPWLYLPWVARPVKR